MSADVKRGYSPDDERDFLGPALITLRRASEELFYLLNRGYPIKSASTFIGNHYLLSERQRIALARAMMLQPKVLVAAYPTRGLDIGAAEYVHEMLVQASREGMGVILISEELDEVQKLSDRIAVFFDGRIMQVLPVAQADEKTLGLLMAGLTPETENTAD